MTEGGEPIAYAALPAGVPVTSATGRQFGRVKTVVAVPDEDIFRGIVVATADGPRFVDADRVASITTTEVRCTLADAEVPTLPLPPDDKPTPPERKPWFAPSPLAQGLGQLLGFRPRGRSIPLTWQGWVITIGLVALAVFLAIFVPGHH